MIKNININAVKQLLKKTQTQNREIFSCMRYREDSIAFTDGSNLAIIKANNGENIKFNLNVHTGHLNPSAYPSLETVKPKRETLKEVEELKVEYILGELYYHVKDADDYRFKKKDVDYLFKTVGLKINNVLGLEISKSGMLVFETDDVYLLMYGCKKINTDS